jgi:DNA-binding NarL/FixJ family response regulator
MTKIKVLIADDQDLIRDGIRIILDSQPDIEVVGVAENGKRVIELIPSCRPDVILMDVRMSEMSGIEALKAVKTKYPEIVVLMLTTFDPDDYILGAFRNGADGYLLKNISSDKLIAAIRDSVAGTHIIPAEIAAWIIAQIPKQADKRNLGDYKLTRQETKIANLVAKGYHNEKISQELGITLGTVKNYISSIYSKLEVNSRKEAICLIKGIREQSGKH